MKKFLVSLMMVGAVVGFGDCVVDSVVGLPVGAVEAMANDKILSGDWYYTILEDGTAKIAGHIDGIGDWDANLWGIEGGVSGDIVIPSEIDGKQVTSIGEKAFYFCSELTSIEIPDSVTSIGDEAFERCSGLTSVHIPDSVTSIGERAFYYCTGLTNINIPNSVINIGEQAFYFCPRLTSIEIPNSVISIGERAFSSCIGLISINIPNSVTSIGLGAFSGCEGLTSIHIPNSVTSIGSGVFSGCEGLMSVHIPDSVTSIGRVAFSGCISLTSIEIPDSVTSIGEDAFSGCSSLTSIEIPDSVTSIGDYTFSGCSSLTSIEISNSVTSLEWHTFSGCISLTSIEIPNSVTSIGECAFYGCRSLTDVYYTGTEAEWNVINILKSGNIPYFLNATIHYNSTLPTDSTTQPAETPQAQVSQALPTAGAVLVNGQAVSFDAYSINDNNYFKLRDLAEVLKGDGKGFAIAWDGEKQAINMVTGGAYESVGTELAQGDGQAKDFTENSATILLDGAEVSMEAYIINDNTYFKLRDVCQLFDIGVTWDGDTQTIGIDTSISY